MNVQELIDELSKVEDKTKEVIINDYDNGQSYPCLGIFKTIEHPYADFECGEKYNDTNAIELEY